MIEYHANSAARGRRAVNERRAVVDPATALRYLVGLYGMSLKGKQDGKSLEGTHVATALELPPGGHGLPTAPSWHKSCLV
jgi:hypothetical protein